MSRFIYIDPKIVADISAELATRKQPDMPDEEIMFQIGLSTRAVYNKTLMPDADLLSDCATEVAKQEIGLDRAMAVVCSGEWRGRAKILSVLQAVGEIH